MTDSLRVRDRTGSPNIPPENNYGSVSAFTTIGSALRSGMVPTDNFYADKDRQPWWGFHPYAPDLALGRLIETPDEIINQIDAFLASDGSVPTNAAVVGWDFMIDGAQEVRDIWQNDGFSVSDTLISDNWGKSDFIREILDRSHNLVSLGHHANHYTIGVPKGTSLDSYDINASTGDHTQSLIFSIGCHSGLNVPPDNPVESFDLAQAFVSEKATYVGNTGYGIGSTIGWSGLNV